MRAFYLITSLLGLVLQLALSVRLLTRRHPFPVLTLYSLALVAATGVESFAIIVNDKRLYHQAFWLDEVFLDGLVVLLVLSFIHRSLRNQPNRASIMAGLTASVFLVGVLSTYFLYQPGVPAYRWMPAISRNIAFFAAALNMILWLLIIRRFHQNRDLLLFTGGLGIQTTGQAISLSLNTFLYSKSTNWLPSLFAILSHFLCLYVWWRALDARAETPVARTNPEPVTLL